jgi:uncharacterized membrane protein
MIASLFAPLLLTAVAQHDYEYEALNVPAPSLAQDINNRGQIVGYTFASGPPQGFLVEGGVTTIFTFPNAPATVAQGINNAGDIVGAYSLTGDPADGHGFLRDASGNFTSFDFPGPTALFTQGWGINNNGDVVGFYFDGSDFELHGFVRYADGTFQSLDHPNAQGATIATGINVSGLISGLYNDPTVAPVTGWFRYQGAFVDVLFPGSTSTDIMDVNDHGGFVGNFHLVDNNPFAPDGPAYVNTGRGVAIIEFPGAEDTDLWGLNDRGDVVGSFFPDQFFGPPFAFVARRPGRLTR